MFTIFSQNCCVCSLPHASFEEFKVFMSLTNDEMIDAWVNSYCGCPFGGQILTGKERYISDEDDYGTRCEVLDPFHKHDRYFYWHMKENVASIIFNPGQYDCDEDCNHEEEA